MAMPVGAVAFFGVDHIHSQSGSNRRGSHRVPASDLCELIAANGTPICSCLVHNLSKSGAMLEISAQSLPPQFVLFNHQHRFKVASKVVWHRGHLVGVEFVTKPREI